MYLSRSVSEGGHERAGEGGWRRTITPVQNERAGHGRRGDEGAGSLCVLDLKAAGVVLQEHREGTVCRLSVSPCQNVVSPLPFLSSPLSPSSFGSTRTLPMHVASKEREATNLQSECAGIRATFPARTSAARTGG